MTMIYDPPTYSDSGQTPPPWHGPEGPGGPGGPSGYGGGAGGPRHPVHRFRHGVLLAATAVVAGLGTFFGLMSVTGNSGNPILTTAQVALSEAYQQGKLNQAAFRAAVQRVLALRSSLHG